MAEIRSSRQLTSLLDNRALARLERMRLCPIRRLTNRSRGEHLSGKGGTSTEFSDYRDYVPGDDVRSVDWNIFARLNRPYVKQYQFEEELHVVLLIDASTSMQFDGKLDRARQLAAAFGMMGLLNVEKVSAHVCHHKGREPKRLPPCTGRTSVRKLFAFLEQIEAGGDSPLEAAVDDVLRRHRGRGIVCLLSDFLTFGDLERPLNLLFSAGLEVFAVQILSPQERQPELAGDLRFVDSETQETLDVTASGGVLSLYYEHLAAMEARLAAMCRRRSGRFASISSREPIEAVLFDRLRRTGWIR